MAWFFFCLPFSTPHNDKDMIINCNHIYCVILKSKVGSWKLVNFLASPFEMYSLPYKYYIAEVLEGTNFVSKAILETRF